MGRTFKETYSPDPVLYGENHTHIFRKDICECEECKEKRGQKEENEPAKI